MANVTVTNNGATVNNSGKIGKCYDFDGSSTYIKVTIPNLSNFPTTTCSMCAWIKFPTTSAGNKQILNIGTSDGWTNIRFGILYRGGTSSAQVITTLSDGTNYVAYNCNGNITENAWNHIAAVYSNRELKLYINGNFIKTYTTTYDISLTNITALGIGGAPNGREKFAGSINDVRIYDEALSPKQIKLLSQGLVLHYPLNRGGFGCDNNIAISNIISRGCSSFTYNTSTQEWIMTCPAGSSTWGYGITISNSAIKWKVNEAWVVSMEVYVPRVISWNRDINNKPDVDDVSSYTGNDYDVQAQRYAYTNGISGQTLQVGWNKIWFSQTAPTTYGLYNYSTNWGVVTTNETSAIDIKIRNIKGEIIPTGTTIHPTPWIPNSADALYTKMGLNGNVEYDCSGFGNNGEYYAYDSTGSVTYESDTPRYNTSTHIASANPSTSTDAGTRYLYGHCAITNPTQMSVSFWCKPIHAGYSASVASGNGIFCTTNYECGTANCGTDYQASAMHHRDSTVDINDSASTTQCRPTLSIKKDEWHHYVITYDGQVGRVYTDGVQTSTAQFSAAKTLDSFIGVVIGYSKAGGVKRRNDACYSDFRVYMTCLSADDILDLYHTPVSLASNGTLLTQGSYSEV